MAVFSQRLSEPATHFSIIWLDLKRLAIMSNRIARSPLLQEEIGKLFVVLGGIGPYFECLQKLGQRPIQFSTKQERRAEIAMGVGISGSDFECLLEMCYRLDQSSILPESDPDIVMGL